MNLRLLVIIALSLSGFWALLAQTPSRLSADTSRMLHVDVHSRWDALIIHANRDDLDLRVYSVTGEPIPSTLITYDQGSNRVYETGHDLQRGLYLVKVQGPGYRTVIKLFRRGPESDFLSSPGKLMVNDLAKR